TVWGSPSDSFLVTFNDLFHYEKIDWEYLPKDSARPGAKSPDSVYLYLTPRPRFKHAPVSRFRFYSDDSIFVQRRKKSADDISVVVWGKSRIPNEWAPSDSLVMPVKDFAISEDPENIRICPSCGESYKIDANVRLKLKGEINFKVLRKNEGNIAENEFLRMQFFNKLYSDAAIAAVNTINADTAMFIKSENQAKELIFGAVPPDTVILTPSDSSKIAAIRDSVLTTVRDSLTAKNLQSALDKMKPNSTLQLAEESPRVVTTDSVQAWDNPERIKALLFPAQISDKAARLAENEKVQALTMQLLAQESYIIASIDTIGITITCPIVSFYDPPQKTFLQKIFGVGPVENHGRIKNSDYSWSEKK
ncbi:MAG: hypothetical protein H8E87_07620, partial [FCB group bacterium]|nr:hypothetical protein [FCB group bacterium]